MKKVLAAALLCAASSFAAWDYFPVITEGNGQGRISSSGDAQIRYSPMQNLEVFASSGGNPTIRGTVTGARFQMGLLSVGADLAFPIAGRDLGIAPNVQLSTSLTEALAVGAGADFGIQFEDDTVMRLRAGGELNLSLGPQTIFRVGLDAHIPITEDNEDVALDPMVGVKFYKGMFALGTYIVFETGDGDYIIRHQGVAVTVGF